MKKETTIPTNKERKEIHISGATYWYNALNGTLYYDYLMLKPTPKSIFNYTEYQKFLKQIANYGSITWEGTAYKSGDILPHPVPTPLEVNEGKQPANTVGEWTKGKLYIGGQNSIRVDNNEAETWQHPSIFIFTGGNLANANRLIQTWSEYDGLCKTVGKLSMAVSNRDKEIEALKKELETGANQYTAKVMENEALKSANRELLEALKELQLDCVDNQLMPKTAKVATIRKAQKAISKHSKQTT